MDNDLEVLAVVAINYAPDKSFEELWHGTNMQEAMRAKGCDADEIAHRYQQICEELKSLREAEI